MAADWHGVDSRPGAGVWQGAGVRLAGDEWGDRDAPPALLLHGAGQTDPRIMVGGPNSITWQVPDPGTGEPTLAHHAQVAQAAPSITVPTLLIRGLRSELVSERSVRALREVIPHATHLDVADAGHMIVGDRNDAFTSQLAGYLGRLRAADDGPLRR